MQDRFGPAYSSFPDPDRSPSSSPSPSGGSPCPETSTCCEVSNNFDEVHAVRDLILNEIRKAGFDESVCFGVQLALDEALANAVIHGNGRSADATVAITYDVTPQSIYLSIQDEGSGFDPTVVDDPTREENLEVPAGRGLFLMRAYMTQVHYNDRGNCVTMLHQKTTQNDPGSANEGNEKDSA